MYSSPDSVRELTGIDPRADFLLEDDPEGTVGGKTADEKLDAALAVWLSYAKGLIDAHRNRDYEQEVADGKRDKVPDLVHFAALRIAANIVGQAKIRRNMSIVQVDQFLQQIIPDAVFTKSIKDDLTLIPAKRYIGFKRLKNAHEIREILEQR